MATLTEEKLNDKIELVNRWNLQIREATIIKRDNVELTRSFHRRVLTPGTLDSDDKLIETDLSSEDADVKAIAEAAWTDQVKTDYTAFLVANKPAESGS